MQKTDVKIKPRKGRPAKKSELSIPELDDDLKGILTTRWTAKEAIARDLSSSPPLKSVPRRWLSSLAHDSSCQCRCCAEPCLARATARWAALQAELILHLDPPENRASIKLQLATLDRCKSISTKLTAKLSQLLPSSGSTKRLSEPTLVEDVVGRVYLCMALSELRLRQSKAGGVWKILEAGIKFVNSSPSPALRPVRASLVATKAVVSLVTLAAQKRCSPEELFCDVWTWNPPKVKKRLKSDQKTGPSLSSLEKKKKKPEETTRISDADAANKVEKPTKTIKVAKVRTEVKSSRTRTAKMPPPMTPMTPMTARSKPSGRQTDVFDFNLEVPVFACTPVQSRRAPTSVQKTQRTASKLQVFQVYEESSPGRGKVGPVPAAPKRTKKSIFKVGIS